MPSFKPKANKKIKHNEKKSVTLDNKHNEKMKEFNNDITVVIPKLETKKKELIHRLQNSNINLEQSLEIKDEIKSISQKIKKIKKKKKEYLLQNSKYIFDYFENKQNISKGDNKTKMLDDFFNIKKETNKKDHDQENIVEKFLCNVDDSFLNMNQFIKKDDICTKCYKGELIPVSDEGILVCNQCGIQIKYLTENEKPSYKEPPKEVCFYAYKRINHFREILAQFQAKETTQIPDEVMDNIQLQLKKERLTIDQFCNKKAKEILKKLGYNKYYEHIPFIKEKLGIKPPVMSQELEETLCNLFMEIQRPYAKFCPDDRVNFLNYYYTVYKLCELLEQDEFLPFFPMLKDREKRIEQDEIWKQICDELQWQFIPTI